jgi:hypothetical protein
MTQLKQTHRGRNKPKPSSSLMTWHASNLVGFHPHLLPTSPDSDCLGKPRTHPKLFERAIASVRSRQSSQACVEKVQPSHQWVSGVSILEITSHEFGWKSESVPECHMICHVSGLQVASYITFPVLRSHVMSCFWSSNIQKARELRGGGRFRVFSVKFLDN